MLIFRTPYDQFKHRNGQFCYVVKVIDQPDKDHDEEVLPMFLIHFEDGREIDAWPEELAYE
jgi:hypothetical protein